MMNRTQSNSQRGSALLIALVLTGMLSLIALMAIDNSQTEIDLSFNKINSDRSFYIAEAGVQHAHTVINATPGWNAGLAGVAFAGGAYSVSVRDSLSEPALADSVVLLSQGEVNGARSTIEATLAPEPFYPFRYGLFADSGVAIGNSVSTDSWNSDSASYAGSAVNAYGSVGSNGPIVIENNPTISGDVYTAQAGAITITGTGRVLGDTSSQAPELDFSKLISPTQFADAEAVNRAPLGMSGSFTYNNGSRDLRIGAGQTMVLESGTYVLDDILLEQSTKLVLAPGAQVELYVTGNIDLRNKATVNSGGKPGNFRVYSRGTRFTMGQSSEFTGAVIAPNVNFNLAQYTDFYGSLMSNRIDLSNNPRFHYDRSLGLIINGTTGRMIQVAWRELE